MNRLRGNDLIADATRSCHFFDLFSLLSYHSFYSIWPIDTVSLSPHSRLLANLYRLNMLLMQFLKVSPVSASKVCHDVSLFQYAPYALYNNNNLKSTHTRVLVDTHWIYRIIATNGVVIATEKKSASSLVDDSTVEKVAMVCANIGMVYSGMGPDFRVLVAKARKAAQQYKRVYMEEPPTRILVQEIAGVMQEYTQSG